MKRLSVIIILVLNLLVLAQTEAPTKKSSAGSVGIGPIIGYQRSGDADAGKFMYGGALRMKLSDAFGIEGSIHYRTEQIRNNRVTVRSWPVQVSALVYPFENLYAIGGAGWYHTTFDYDPGFQEEDLADQTLNPFGWHIGAGAEVPLGESIKIIGDVRYVFLNYDDLEDFGDVPLDEVKSNFYIISVGLMIGLR